LRKRANEERDALPARPSHTSKGFPLSIFGTILNKIFHHASEGAAPSTQPAAPAPTTPAPSAATPTATPTAPAQAAATPTQQPVDVEAVLTKLAAAKGRPSNWRESIVDLLQLLDMDSSLSARKELANELNVHVGGDGSAEENVALHKAVMKKLAENGGKVPDNLKG
jgi:3-oxoacyl-ACP reductase-like protein